MTEARSGQEAGQAEGTTRWMFEARSGGGAVRAGRGRGRTGRRSESGEEVVRNTGQMGRRAREESWREDETVSGESLEFSLELEAPEQEVMRRGPDRGPRDLEVTAATTELTTSAPAARVRACLSVGGSASVHWPACKSLCRG